LVSNAPLLNRFTGVVGLLLAGGFGLTVMWLLPEPSVAVAKPPPPVKEVEELPEFPEPAPLADTEGAVQIRYATPRPPEPTSDELVKFCSSHVTEDRSFVLFSRGSCVLVKEPSADPVTDAVELLESCADSSARFVPERTKDGGLIIAFKEPVFHRFLSQELDELAPWLNQVTPTLMTPDESMAAGEDWIPPYHARVGLLARRRMLEDAATPVAIRVIRAKPAETAAK